MLGSHTKFGYYDKQASTIKDLEAQIVVLNATIAALIAGNGGGGQSS